MKNLTRIDQLSEAEEIFRAINDNPPKRGKLHSLKVGRRTLRQILQSHNLPVEESIIEEQITSSEQTYIGTDNHFYVSEKGARRYSIPLSDLRNAPDLRKNNLLFPESDERYNKYRTKERHPRKRKTSDRTQLLFG